MQPDLISGQPEVLAPPDAPPRESRSVNIRVFLRSGATFEAAIDADEARSVIAMLAADRKGGLPRMSNPSFYLELGEVAAAFVVA